MSAYKTTRVNGEYKSNWKNICLSVQKYDFLKLLKCEKLVKCENVKCFWTISNSIL